MGLGHSPRIVTDGLVLALDAGNPKNYNAGISTNWVDKVGGNNGTLVGGTHHNDGPFVGAGYVEFDGIDSIPYDYVTTSTSSDFTLGTDDFTIEFFFKSNNSTNRTFSTVIAANMDNANTGFWELEMNADSSGTIVWKDRGNTRITATNTNCYNDQWHHLALTREGTSVKLFLDGTQIGSTATYSYTYAGSSVVFGSRRLGSSVWNGNISNLRIIKGTALYTSNFTPPTKQLTAITNTVLLTCQGNTISDVSSGGHTLTANGTVAANLGFPASAFEFDGTDDYVTIPSSTLELDTNTNFTLEYWVYTSTSGLAPAVAVNASTSKIIAFFLNDASFSTFYSILSESNYPSSGNSNALRATTDISTNTWTHISFVRLSGTITIYINGVASGTVSNAFSSRPLNLIGAIAQGGAPNFYFLNGKVSALKIYKGKGLTAEEIQQNYNALKGRYV